jgi:hypothetical protein
MIRPNSAASNQQSSQENTPHTDDGIPCDVNVGTVVAAESGSDEQVFHSSETEALAAPFVNRWNHLVSTTNWEKGAIIVQWRTELIANNAQANQYSDDAWARSVEGVSPQHVGRLRRVYERFKDTYPSYKGLFWTHFLAAMEWPDAELWLEGALQSKWSVSEMRRTRWEATGKDPSQSPAENPVMTVDADEDFTPLSEAEDSVEVDREPDDRIGTTGPLNEGPDFGEGESEGDVVVADNTEYEEVDDTANDTFAGSNPFSDLPDLPTDIEEAMEQFKLAIVRHRLAEWSEVTPAIIQRVLDSLSTFVQSGG